MHNRAAFTKKIILPLQTDLISLYFVPFLILSISRQIFEEFGSLIKELRLLRSNILIGVPRVDESRGFTCLSEELFVPVPCCYASFLYIDKLGGPPAITDAGAVAQ